MKIADRRDLQEISFNCSLDKIDEHKYLMGEKVLLHATA